MTCPRCKTPFTELLSVLKLSDSINQYGRQEIVYQAEHKEWVHWLKDHFHCSKCGLDFSFNDHTFQNIPLLSFTSLDGEQKI